jgi:hypothetical protein
MTARRCPRSSAGQPRRADPGAVPFGGREVAVLMARSWLKEPSDPVAPARHRLFQVRLEDGHRRCLARESDGS